MTSYPTILIAYKRSRYEQIMEHSQEETPAPSTKDAPPPRQPSHPLFIDQSYWLEAHDRHRRSLEQVVTVMDQFNLTYDLQFRGDIEKVTGYDLVITVGGDGTVLDLSHKVDSTPLLAINSDPQRSVGYFCAGTPDDLPHLLSNILSQAISPMTLMRFGLAINAQIIDLPVLNDILVANENPAVVSKYAIDLGSGDAEKQRSSGIWISSPAGSTAGIKSAGGLVLGIESRDIQYLVREPCPPPGASFRHTKGLRSLDEPFSVTSLMLHGRLYLDGPHTTYPFGFGDVLTLDGSKPDLRIYAPSLQLRE